MENKRKKQMVSTQYVTMLLATIAISLVSLMPRIAGLTGFLVLDEYLWLNRSRNFTIALMRSDWVETMQTGHPGVTTMWTGSLGLWLYGLRHQLFDQHGYLPFLQSLSWSHQPQELMLYMRLPTVIIVTTGILGISWLMAQLFGRRVGLVAGLILALDPWMLAHSRTLHHDALMTTFMTLSALALLVHTQRTAKPWLLLLSGVCASLALLSKTLALFVLPWMALLLAVVVLQRKRALAETIVDGAIWLVTAAMTFYVVWPAMWLKPIGTLRQMYLMLATYAQNPHGKGLHFMGQATADPGVPFYLAVALFALTPIVIGGLLMLIVQTPRFSKQGQSRPVLLLMVVYVVMYFAWLALGEKKQDRYVLPAIVMLQLLGAVGITGFGSTVLIRIQSWTLGHFSRWAAAALVLALVIGQAAVSLPHFPYYSTYYNPLAGGNRVADYAIQVGRGEGSELAAEWLNSLPESERLKVVASQPSTFAPFFDGETVYWDPIAQALSADYVVLYRTDILRGLPDVEFVRYIRESWPVEKTIMLHELPYAWIYRAPAADWANVEVGRTDRLTRLGLLGYKLESRESPIGSVTAKLYVQTPPTSGYWTIRVQDARSGAVVGAPNPALVYVRGEGETNDVFQEVQTSIPLRSDHMDQYRLLIDVHAERDSDSVGLTLQAPAESHAIKYGGGF